ncbi:hypothetical protein CPB83DRAFT_894514 [Crepidotus variabilis]|uniref:HNH nuclease domain-containing protein n=1 Tax=Crepidotus variabilis TaxID=179855 RepID=A0A9P6EEW2_9AGAR|nr:hypothetical protein CPB83DRAFT_894514 [Crepidotus variabilis]
MSASEVSSASPPKLSISDLTKARVRSVATNGGRCLVENIEQSCVVDYHHCFPAHLGRNGDLLDRIEWYWNMERGSLNLNTRWNIFSVGANLHRLRSHQQWVLLPEDDIIQQYFGPLTPAGTNHHAERSTFPDVPNRSDFVYRLIPLRKMENLVVVRQDVIPEPGTPLKEEHLTIHLYPFNALHLTSHVHPKFAILEAGRIFEKLSNTLPSATLATLSEMYPTLPLTISLFQAWTDSLPIDAMNDQTYNTSDRSIHEHSDENHDGRVLEDGSSQGTSRHRYGEVRRQYTRNNFVSSHERRILPAHRDQRTLNAATGNVVGIGPNVARATWNADAIRSWAEGSR